MQCQFCYQIPCKDVLHAAYSLTFSVLQKKQDQPFSCENLNVGCWRKDRDAGIIDTMSFDTMSKINRHKNALNQRVQIRLRI